MSDDTLDALRRQHLEETHRASGGCPGWTCPTARILAAPDGCGECMGWPGHHPGCSKYGIPRTEAGARLQRTLEDSIYNDRRMGGFASADIVAIEDEAEVRAANRGVLRSTPAVPDALATESPTEQPAPPDGSAVAPLDVERLASALVVVLRPPTTPMAGGFLEFAAAIARESAALCDKP